MKKLMIASILAATSLSTVAEGGYVGAAYGQVSVDIDAPPIAGLTLSQDEKGKAFKVFGGYDFHNNLAVEIGYLSASDMGASYSSGAFNAGADLEASGFFADLVGKLPVSESFTLFAKLGIARMKLEAEPTGLAAGVVASESDNSTSPRFGIGAEYNLNKQFGLRAEFERTSDVGDKDNIGESDVDYLGVAATFKF